MQPLTPSEITAVLRRTLDNFEATTSHAEVGTILQIGNGVARIHGLTQIKVGELISFPHGLQGLVLNLEEDTVGAVVLGNAHTLKEGDMVKRTHRHATLPVGDGLLGRVVDTLGQPIDGKGPIEGKRIAMPLEREAPGIIYRQPVATPLQTGIKTIDTMIPIGRGQRELLIGDRQTGKTRLAIDTILNQLEAYQAGKPVHCIYVAVGQKAATVAELVAELTAKGAMPYTTIVAATASVPAALQFLTPFAGTAIGEYFRDTGRHALVIYDDLSKQAVAYREIALLLRRPPGREAYPGDIFYLHARILERAAQLIDDPQLIQQMNGLPQSIQSMVAPGGSLTALPIIETQGNDVSAYIPTNVISITDGQIFLEKNLFNAGIRPAINVGISVSRVGGAAQLKGMKQVAGVLKLGQAQFRELEAFTKFGAEVDKATAAVIRRGQVNQEILKQPAGAPMPVAHQIALVYVATQGALDDLPLDQVKAFEKAYLALLAQSHRPMLAALAKGDKLTKTIQAKLIAAAEQIVGNLVHTSHKEENESTAAPKAA